MCVARFRSVHFHFYELEQRGFTTAVYINYEAVPLKPESDFFIDSTLFKVN